MQVEAKVDAAAEAREGMSNRMNLLLGLVITFLLAGLPILSVVAYKVDTIIGQVEDNSSALEQLSDDVRRNKSVLQQIEQQQHP